MFENRTFLYQRRKFLVQLLVLWLTYDVNLSVATLRIKCHKMSRAFEVLGGFFKTGGLYESGEISCSFLLQKKKKAKKACSPLTGVF